MRSADALTLANTEADHRILEKAEILYHAGRFRLEWDQVRATLDRFDEINVENDSALIGCEIPFRLDPENQLTSYVQRSLTGGLPY